MRKRLDTGRLFGSEAGLVGKDALAALGDIDVGVCTDGFRCLVVSGILRQGIDSNGEGDQVIRVMFIDHFSEYLVRQ